MRPCLTHTLQSLLSLLVNIDPVRARVLSIVEVVSLVVVGFSLLVLAGFTIYYYCLLEPLKEKPKKAVETPSKA